MQGQILPILALIVYFLNFATYYKRYNIYQQYLILIGLTHLIMPGAVSKPFHLLEIAS